MWIPFHQATANTIKMFMIIIATLLLFSQFSHADACSCLATKEPQYCNTDFFALVHIVAEQTNPNQMTIRYRFKPMSIIRDPLHLLESRRYKHLHTYLTSAACGVELNVGERYLIGGNLDRENDRLTLNLCRSYVAQFSKTIAVVTKEFQSLLENCNNLNPQDDQKEDNEENNPDQLPVEDSKHNVENQEGSTPLQTSPNQSTTIGINQNDQLEREGKPIMKFVTAMTEDDVRRSRRHRGRRNRRLIRNLRRRNHLDV